MTTVKNGMITASKEWRVHLRWTKRLFWKVERRAAKQASKGEASGD